MENKENSVDKTELTKRTIKVGNSAGVLLPKSWLGGEVKVILLKKPLDIKKDVLEILENYFSDLLGIYITNLGKQIEVLAISTAIRKVIQNGKYKISIVPLKLIKQDLKNEPRLKVRLNQAKVILNKALLFDLRKI